MSAATFISGDELHYQRSDVRAAVEAWDRSVHALRMYDALTELRIRAFFRSDVMMPEEMRDSIDRAHSDAATETAIAAYHFARAMQHVHPPARLVGTYEVARGQ